MDVLWVAATGVAIVLGSILLLRLHPLIGLLVGSLFIFAATPRSVQVTNRFSDDSVQVVSLASGGLIGTNAIADAGDYHLLSELKRGGDLSRLTLTRATPEQLRAADARGELSPSVAVWFSTGDESPSLSLGSQLVSAADAERFEESRWKDLGTKLAEGFAATFRKLGIPVTMAAIVGICLLESGAAARLVSAIMAIFGSRGTAPALTVSGFILGIPVFFDNVFYLLLPLAKAVGRQHPEKYLSAVMAIIVGASMAHSLVPPTPGPLLVAAAMQVNVGMMMLAGFVVGACAASVGFTYGMLCNRWIHLVPESPTVDAAPVARASTRRIPLLLAALPIAVPILVLGGSEVVAHLSAGSEPSGALMQLQTWLSVVSDPGLIFIATAIMSIALLRYYSSKEVVGRSVSRGIADAGTIVLLTCAGGAFGASLQQLDLAGAIGGRFEGLTTPWGMLFTAFFLTTMIRAAQGSATVAMITSAAIVAPVTETIALPFHPVYLALAIGCGSKPLPWMNDSGFWQVATMTGLTTGQTLKTFSVALTLMGIAGFAVTLLGAWLLPLV